MPLRRERGGVWPGNASVGLSDLRALPSMVLILTGVPAQRSIGVLTLDETAPLRLNLDHV